MPCTLRISLTDLPSDFSFEVTGLLPVVKRLPAVSPVRWKAFWQEISPGYSFIPYTSPDEAH